MDNIIDVLEERGFVEALTSDELRELAEKPLTVYCGIDPTGDSLHLGHMVAIMGLAWFRRLGHKTVALVGGATGMIGDPSGKSSERNLLDEETILRNVSGIKDNLKVFLDFEAADNRSLLLNNLDWFSDFSMINFLRDVGKFFRIGPMLSKESVRLRLNSEEGLSFTEFSYQLLQAYDFLYLNEHHNVNVQIGGSDQWGNITAGIDLLRKVHGRQGYGITFPLLTRSDGKKFGKTEEGAVWLSPEKLSPYKFYQYLVRVPDQDVIKLMRMLTFMEMSEVRRYEQMMNQNDYVPNTAQKRLAEEVTRLVHGEEGLQTALKVTEMAKPGSETTLDVKTLESISEDMPSCSLKRIDVIGNKLVDLLVLSGLQASKGQARKLIQNGGVYLNNIKIDDENLIVSSEHIVGDALILLSVGKKNKMLVRMD